MSSFGLLERFGIELEYMIVDRSTLDVKAVTDKLFKKVNGSIVNEVENPKINWSNELVMHVLEFKNAEPASSLIGLEKDFQAEIIRANAALKDFHAELLPGAMHPWMNPNKETVIWPHENSEIYKTYDRVFGCSGHGWSNLQSMHINLSFATDEEFGKLHAAVRAILPLIPILSASSPVVEGKPSEYASSRLNFYLKNQKKVASIMGDCIPEAVWTKADYQTQVLQKMYNELKPIDSENVLQEEWLNSRGAIPKFNYGCIEIRLADVQECPLVDISVALFWIKVIQNLINEKYSSLDAIKRLRISPLRHILDLSVKDAEDTIIEDKEFLSIFNLHPPKTGKDLLAALLSKLNYSKDEQIYYEVIESIIDNGSLSTRLRHAIGVDLRHEHLQEVYAKLAKCLNQGKLFEV